MRNRAIELHFPAKSISEHGSHERYIRKAHPYGAKTWWARRPLTAMRALVFATAAHSSDSELIERLARDIDPDIGTIQEAKNNIRNSYKEYPPRMIDFFSGGGGIPFEAARLGIEAHSVELNPIAVILQRALFEGTQIYPRIADDVRHWGEVALNRSQGVLNNFFSCPSSKKTCDEEPIVYFWSRTVKCPKCGIETPLSRLPYLAKRKKRVTTLKFDPEAGASGEWVITEVHGSSHEHRIGQRRKGHVCAFCRKSISTDYLKMSGKQKQIREILQAVALSGPNYRGKRYISSADVQTEKLPGSEELEGAINSTWQALGGKLPQFLLKQWSGIVNPTVYGYYSVEQLFNKRQLLTLLTLIRELRSAYAEILETGLEKGKADSVILILTSLVDHLADWNSAFTMWIPQNEQCGRSLAGPGIAMLWDYIEVNPFGIGPANLKQKLKRVVESIKAIPKLESPIYIRQGSALDLPYPEDFFDLAVIDPPYHDSLFYSALSDCFFPWQKLLLEGTVLPFNSLVPLNEESEIVASKHRHPSSSIASDKYKLMMRQALEEANRVLKHDSCLTMVYSHKTAEGWATIAEAIRKAGFRVVQTWPLYMERKARPRAMKSDTLSSVVAIVMRKRRLNEVVELSDTLRKEIEEDLREHFILLQKDGWLGTDLLVACVGQSLVHFTSGPDLVSHKGESVSFQDYLKGVEGVIQRIVYDATPEEICSGAANNLDIITRVYLAWRRTYGEVSLTEDQFRQLCKDINDEIDYAELLKEDGRSPFRRRGHCVLALKSEERDLAGIQSIPGEQQTYIDKIHLLISSKVSNDSRINQTADCFGTEENEIIIAVLTMLGGTELTSLDHRRLDPEKLAVRKLLSRLATGSRKNAEESGEQLTLRFL